MSKKTHIKGLDSLRAIAAFIVLIGHIELFKNRYQYDNYFHIDFFSKTGGHISVILFFALSGFLITLLLINEKKDYQSISLKKFYLRRIFRVWPLYFLIIILSYFIFNYNPSLSTIILCLTIFPNIAHALDIGWSVSPQIWSIGVEEQFYLFWPLLIKLFKNVLLTILFVFVFFTLLPHLIQFLSVKFYYSENLISIVDKIYIGTKFNCMAAGGFFAVLYFNKSKIINYLNYNKVICWMLVFFPFILWFSGFHMNYFTDELYSILFSISIFNITLNQSFFKSNSVFFTFLLSVLTYLGKISYGLYMYHWIVLELVFRYNLLNFKNGVISNVILYFFVIVVTLFLSHFSYFYFESGFLRLKEKFNRH